MRAKDFLASIWDEGSVVGDYWVSLPYGPTRFMVHIPTHSTLILDPLPRQSSLQEVAFIAGIELKDERLIEKQSFNTLGNLETYILNSSYYRHTGFATLTAQMIVSILAAPAYTTPDRNGKLNQFHIIVGDSGCGKNDYVDLIETILNRVFGHKSWLHGEPQSKSALQMCMVRRNYGSIIMSEGFNFLNSKQGDNTYGCSKLLMNTWASNGNLIELPTKDYNNITPKVSNPVIGMILEMIPEDFNEALENRDVIKGGLIQRCSWAIHDQPRYKNKESAQEIDEEIIHRLGNICPELILQANNNLTEFAKWVELPKKTTPPPNFSFKHEKEQVRYGDGAKERYDQITNEFRNLSEEYKEEYQALSTIYVRSHEKIMRMACASAIYEQAYEKKKELLPLHLDAAYHYEMNNLENFRNTFKEYEKVNEHERVREKLDQMLVGRPVNIREFRRITKAKGVGIVDAIINQACSDGICEFYLDGRKKMLRRV